MNTQITTFDEFVSLADSGRMERFQMLITPKIADRIIKWIQKDNLRPARLVCAMRYAEIMRRGKWVCQPETDPLKFSVDKKILSGMVRLRSVICADCPVLFNVEVNLSETDRLVTDSVSCDTCGTGGSCPVPFPQIAQYMTGRRLDTNEAFNFISRYKRGFSAIKKLFPVYRKGIVNAPVLGEFIRASYHMEDWKIAHYAQVLRDGVSDDRRDNPLLLLHWKLCCGELTRKGRNRFIGAITRFALDAAYRGICIKELEEAAENIFPLPDNENSSETEKNY